MIDLSVIPKNPGCYLFKDKNGIILYIGKAKNLNKRVSNYFSNKNLDNKTKVLVSQIKSADFIATSNEIEAFILENNLIKKYCPKYNINLKDSKQYAYLEITKEDFPRIMIARGTHQTTKDGILFGPFVSGISRNELLEYLVKTFKIRTCKKLPKKVCLRYSLQLCSAPCINVISKQDYDQSIKYAKNILDGKTHDVILALKERMKDASKNKEYESALNLRNIIDSLKQLNEKQNMQRNKTYDEDIINFQVKNDKVYLLLFNVNKGILERKQDFIFDYSPDFLEEFILQYYSENNIPKELIIPSIVDKSITIFLSSKKKEKVSITVPKKGTKKELLELVGKNVELIFFADENKLSALKEVLNLETFPTIIECFDVSHLSGTAMVASMVQFRNARPSKENYRRFKIKTVKGIDDFSAIAEVVNRRYTRLTNENAKLPDLIIIDGGIGQLNSAVAELKKIGLKIPIISIAKRLEEIYVPNNNVPLDIDKKSQALFLIRNVRDEAHRFAISYNRLIRKKSLVDNL